MVCVSWQAIAGSVVERKGDGMATDKMTMVGVLADG
jgi:hypothetical protein